MAEARGVESLAVGHISALLRHTPVLCNPKVVVRQAQLMSITKKHALRCLSWSWSDARDMDVSDANPNVPMPRAMSRSSHVAPIHSIVARPDWIHND